MLENSKIIFFTLLLLFVLILGTVQKQVNSIASAEQAQQLASEIERLSKRAIKTVNAEHIRCLATNIYHEASGEPFMGQVAVARVVMNRVKHGFASSPCKVIYQSTIVSDQDDPDQKRRVCQFSWVCAEKTPPSKNNPIYIQAEDIARKVLAEDKWREVIPSNVLFFHNINVNPNWIYHRMMTIGNHAFYSIQRIK